MGRILPSIHGRGQMVPADAVVAERRNPTRVKAEETRAAKLALFASPPDFAKLIEGRVEGFAELQALRRATK